MSPALPAPKVSVALITYRHAPYVGACLDSVLVQHTDFPLEIVIGDDGSDDGSQDIIRDYARRFAQQAQFRLLLSPTNRGNFANVMDILSACRGEYVALLEGDDRWCFEDKLQRQVDFLDAHRDYSGCFHDAEIVNDTHTSARRDSVFKAVFRTYSQIHRYTPEITAWQLVERVLVPTSALVYRNGAYLEELKAYADVHVSLGEILKLLVAKGGPYGYFNQVWAVYNEHASGVTKTRPKQDFFAAHTRIYRSLLRDDFYRRYRSHVYDVLARIYTERYWSGATTADGRGIGTLLMAVRYGLMHVLNLALEMLRGLPRRGSS